MPLAANLGLSGLDRSLFGLRRADRLLTTPSPSLGPDEDPEDREDVIQAPPELPPLGALDFSSSFANLLDQLEVSAQFNAASGPVHVSLSSASSETTTPVAASPQLQQTQYAQSAQAVENMEFITTGTYFSTLANSPSKTIPERQQSSTSSATFSRRSDAFSTHSASSRSSVEDVSSNSKALSYVSSDPISIHPLNTDLYGIVFEDKQLDLELTPCLSSGFTLAAINTNKPLPPAPSAASRNNTALKYSIQLPELDSAPVNQLPKARTVMPGAVFFSETTELDATPMMRQTRSSQCLPLEELKFMEPPRRNSARLRQRPQHTKPSARRSCGADMAEQVISQILLNLNSLADLKAAAMINKGFYRVYRRRESHIVERVLRNASPPAWELRQLVKREQKRNPFQMKAIQRDLAALRALQAFILMKCDKLCRKATLQGLAGEHPQQRAKVEDALWRIWTFCKLFGKGTSRDAGLQAQVLWLEGVIPAEKGEKSGSRPGRKLPPVSRAELEDVSEMWRCMENLLSGFRGREPEAREAGIFDQCQIEGSKNETHYLEDWIYDILSVGPKAVLTMISCSFEHAKVLGVNKWTPPRAGRSRRAFLKGALEQVYRDRLVEEARLKAEGFAKAIQQEQPALNRPRSETQLPVQATIPVPSQAQNVPPKVAPIHTKERQSAAPRLEIRPDCDPQASLLDQQFQIPTTSPTTNPAAFSSLAMMSNASTRIGATLFPVQHGGSRQQKHARQAERISVLHTERPAPVDTSVEPRVVDPTDRALSLLVKQLGFPSHLATQALAMSDDGSGIDVQRAVELLSEDRRLEPRQKDTRIAELPGPTPKSSSGVQQIRDYCEGTCRRVSLIQRKRSTLRALMSRSSVRQSFPLDVIIDHDEEDGAVQQLAKRALSPLVPTSMPSMQPLPTEQRSGYQNLTEFLRYRNNSRTQSNTPGQYAIVSGHQKSLSTGTIDVPDENATQSPSPISPATPLSPASYPVGRPASQKIDEHHDQAAGKSAVRPKVTLTRVGTGKKPGRRMSFTGNGAPRPGHPPEIIGYAY